MNAKDYLIENADYFDKSPGGHNLYYECDVIRMMNDFSSLKSDNYEHLKQYLYDRNTAIDKELDEIGNANPFLSAYYNGVKVELKAVEIVIDALIEKQNVLSKIGEVS